MSLNNTNCHVSLVLGDLLEVRNFLTNHTTHCIECAFHRLFPVKIFYFYTLNFVAELRKSNYLPEQTEKVKEFEPGYQDQF